jgi:hypothetical protein
VFSIGTEWEASTSEPVIGNRWRAPTTVPSIQCRMGLYRKGDQLLVAQSQLFTPVAGIDNDVLFDTPFTAAALTRYVSVVVTNRYAFTTAAGWPFAAGVLTAPSGVNGRFGATTAGTLVWPNSVSPGAVCYFIGPLYGLALRTTLPTLIVAAGKRLPGRARRLLMARTPTYPILTGVPVRYDITGPGEKWTVNMSLRHVSVLSREFVPFEVSAYVAGRPYNPTSCAFAVAFLESSRAEPVSGDWVTGDWDTNTIGTYVGRVLVGPSSGAVLAAGRYYPWIRITDPTSGETVVRQVGKLFID